MGESSEEIGLTRCRRVQNGGVSAGSPRAHSGWTQRWLVEAAQLAAQCKCSGASPESALACCLTFGKFLQAFLCLSFPNYKMGKVEERSNV